MELNNRTSQFIKELIDYKEGKKEELIKYIMEDTFSLNRVLEYKRDIKNTNKLLEVLNDYLANEFDKDLTL